MLKEINPRDILRMMAQSSEDDGITIPKDVQIMTLRERYSDYVNGMIKGQTALDRESYEEADKFSVFSPGQLVMPRPNYGSKHIGIPHIVLESRCMLDAEPCFGPNTTSAHNGPRLDLRVLVHVADDMIAAFWVESWQYQTWSE
jgi:hypothetical protein